MLGRFTAPGPPRERPLQAPGPRLRPVARTGSVACKGCGRRFVLERYEGTLRVCPWCGHHGQVPAMARAAQLADPETLDPLEIHLPDRDPLGSTMIEHVYFSREAASGGKGVGGSGCGCN